MLRALSSQQSGLFANSSSLSKTQQQQRSGGPATTDAAAAAPCGGGAASSPGATAINKSTPGNSAQTRADDASRLRAPPPASEEGGKEGVAGSGQESSAPAKEKPSAAQTPAETAVAHPQLPALSQPATAPEELREEDAASRSQRALQGEDSREEGSPPARDREDPCRRSSLGAQAASSPAGSGGERAPFRGGGKQASLRERESSSALSGDQAAARLGAGVSARRRGASPSRDNSDSRPPRLTAPNFGKNANPASSSLRWGSLVAASEVAPPPPRWPPSPPKWQQRENSLPDRSPLPDRGRRRVMDCDLQELPLGPPSVGPLRSALPRRAAVPPWPREWPERIPLSELSPPPRGAGRSSGLPAGGSWRRRSPEPCISTNSHNNLPGGGGERSRGGGAVGLFKWNDPNRRLRRSGSRGSRERRGDDSAARRRGEELAASSEERRSKRQGRSWLRRASSRERSRSRTRSSSRCSRGLQEARARRGEGEGEERWGPQRRNPNPHRQHPQAARLERVCGRRGEGRGLCSNDDRRSAASPDGETRGRWQSRGVSLAAVALPSKRQARTAFATSRGESSRSSSRRSSRSSRSLRSVSSRRKRLATGGGRRGDEVADSQERECRRRSGSPRRPSEEALRRRRQFSELRRRLGGQTATTQKEQARRGGGEEIILPHGGPVEHGFAQQPLLPRQYVANKAALLLPRPSAASAAPPAVLRLPKAKDFYSTQTPPLHSTEWGAINNSNNPTTTNKDNPTNNNINSNSGGSGFSASFSTQQEALLHAAAGPPPSALEVGSLLCEGGSSGSVSLLNRETKTAPAKRSAPSEAAGGRGEGAEGREEFVAGGSKEAAASTAPEAPPQPPPRACKSFLFQGKCGLGEECPDLHIPAVENHKFDARELLLKREFWGEARALRAAFCPRAKAKAAELQKQEAERRREVAAQERQLRLQRTQQPHQAQRCFGGSRVLSRTLLRTPPHRHPPFAPHPQGQSHHPAYPPPPLQQQQQQPHHAPHPLSHHLPPQQLPGPHPHPLAAHPLAHHLPQQQQQPHPPYHLPPLQAPHPPQAQHLPPPSLCALRVPPPQGAAAVWPSVAPVASSLSASTPPPTSAGGGGGGRRQAGRLSVRGGGVNSERLSTNCQAPPAAAPALSQSKGGVLPSPPSPPSLPGAAAVYCFSARFSSPPQMGASAAGGRRQQQAGGAGGVAKIQNNLALQPPALSWQVREDSLPSAAVDSLGSSATQTAPPPPQGFSEAASSWPSGEFPAAARGELQPWRSSLQREGRTTRRKEETGDGLKKSRRSRRLTPPSGEEGSVCESGGSVSGFGKERQSIDKGVAGQARAASAERFAATAAPAGAGGSPGREEGVSVQRDCAEETSGGGTDAQTKDLRDSASGDGELSADGSAKKAQVEEAANAVGEHADAAALYAEATEEEGPAEVEEFQRTLEQQKALDEYCASKSAEFLDSPSYLKEWTKRELIEVCLHGCMQTGTFVPWHFPRTALDASLAESSFVQVLGIFMCMCLSTYLACICLRVCEVLLRRVPPAEHLHGRRALVGDV